VAAGSGTSTPGDHGAAAERLNRGCFCLTIDRRALAAALDRETGVAGLAEQLKTSHSSLFSNVPVFVPETSLAEMARIVVAVEAVARSPDYRAAALSWAPPIAAHDFGPAGALMGYDFHLTPDGPQLIEVNTNAGGAFLNAVLARAQRACCADAQVPFGSDTIGTFDQKIVQMFGDEWTHQRKSGMPRTIAIVDDAPKDQHLYPEFLLAKTILDSHGVQTWIADPDELHFDGDRLTLAGRPIDLVYNRLVDFALGRPEHDTLRAAYVAGAVVVTPNPHVHALLADKRNLALLSDAERLRRWGLPSEHIAVLEGGVPRTVAVTERNAEDLWGRRRQLFFKPAGGHGSKAAYRGDKLTRKVWAQILQADYVAQAYAPPSERGVAVDGLRTDLKVDVRLYTYASSILLAAARLYQGQTTNMRTLGGGFAPVLTIAATAGEGIDVAGSERS
jgi:hypothetical protein